MSILPNFLSLTVSATNTTLYVVDSSVIVKWFHQEREPFAEEALKILEDLHGKKITLSTPDLAIWESSNALRFSKKLNFKQIQFAIKQFFDLPISIIPSTLEIATKAAEIAERYNITLYDACYVAVAKTKNARLISDNPKHHGRIADGTVLALKDYPL